jgi:hypothetical protein
LNRVALFLDSAGGRVDDGDRLIEALNEIKLRHQLITVVPHGKLCASMCIPIFLQGEDRLRRGQVSGPSTRPPNDRQTANCEPTRRRRGGCSANTTLPLGSQRVGSKVSHP